MPQAGDFFRAILLGEHPQCRDVSWNVLKKAGSWYMPHGFMIRGWIRHAGCLTCRFFEDVHGTVPTLWMALS
jgi:hypothetical protein